ncbi:MAG: dephospho-CoA kinase [Armatimonadetes bacterium RBG_16_58_9]|nr:MAG: dephospho-CoA kinase [Armatimonadetes bacterium RBG_16_58_9]
MAYVLGVTGGIATGKTTVVDMLAELGARTLSADRLAREVLSKETPAYHEVVRRFGEAILGPDGEIDRRALASIVFKDPKSRQALEAITHAPIIRRMQDEIDDFRARHASDRAVLVVEIPLLFECGLEKMVDQVLVVSAEQQTQANRLTTRNATSTEEAGRGIASQMPIEQKVGRADRVIANDGDLPSLERAVNDTWKEILLL